MLMQVLLMIFEDKGKLKGKIIILKMNKMRQACNMLVIMMNEHFIMLMMKIVMMSSIFVTGMLSDLTF